MSKMYVQIGGAFLGESGESADSLPAAMWKSRSRRNQVTFYNIFDSWSVLYFKIMTYKSSLSRILWRRSVLSWTLPSYQTQAGPSISQSLYPQLSLFQSANLYSGPVSPHQWSLWSGRRYHCQGNSNTDLYSRLSPNWVFNGKEETEIPWWWGRASCTETERNCDRVDQLRGVSWLIAPS